MAARSFRETTAQKYRDIPLELLFDLVFAFAIPQCADYLWEHLTWRGAAETGVLLLSTVLLWSLCSWVAILVGAERPAVRWMMLGMLLPALFLNASITKTLAGSGWVFVAPLLLLQAIRILSALILAPLAGHKEHYSRVAVWFLASCPLWLVGAWVGPEERLYWWAGALGLDFLGTILAHPVPGRSLHSKNVPFDSDHMLERCRQFLIIALGETVITGGAALAEAPVNAMSLLTGAGTLVEMVALWILMFGRAHRSIVGYMAHTKDPIRGTRFAVTGTLGIVTGFIAAAVANRAIIAHPYDPMSGLQGWLLCGGPMLFFASQGWYLWLVPKVTPKLHWMGGGLLLLIGLFTPVMPAYAAQALVAAGLMGLVVWDKNQ